MTNSSKVFKSVATAFFALGVLAVSASQAAAVDQGVRRACMGDYMNYCAQYGVNVSKVSSCMRRNGNRLSKRCVGSLVKAGYVSKSEVARRSASLTP